MCNKVCEDAKQGSYPSNLGSDTIKEISGVKNQLYLLKDKIELLDSVIASLSSKLYESGIMLEYPTKDDEDKILPEMSELEWQIHNKTKSIEYLIRKVNDLISFYRG